MKKAVSILIPKLPLKHSQYFGVGGVGVGGEWMLLITNNQEHLETRKISQSLVGKT